MDRNDTLKRQIESVNEGKKKHNCSICDHSYSRKDSLMLHIKSTHEGKCSICEYSCSHNEGLKKTHQINS
jgi:hypothetical protein